MAATGCLWVTIFVCTLCISVTGEETCPPKGSTQSCEPDAVQQRAENMERTFLMIKPDGVHRGLVGDIIKRFETKGYKLVAFKFMQATEEILSQHYAEHEGKPFYEGLLKYIMSGPVVPMVWEGKEVISTGRTIIGATNPVKAAPGTIRGDYALVMGKNIIHGSDSPDSAAREVSIWFSDSELVDWEPNQNAWLYE